MTSPTDSQSMSSTPKNTAAPGHASSFRCTQCNKCFNRPENLSRHMKIHDPCKAHVCSVCDKSFSRSDLRRRHEAVHTKSGNGTTRRIDRRSTTRLRRTATTSLSASPGQFTNDHDDFPSDAHDGDFVDVEAPEGIGHDEHMPTGNQILQPIPTPEDEWRHVSQLPFDFDSEAVTNYGFTDLMDNWFPTEFYSALQETRELHAPEDAEMHHSSSVPTIDLLGVADEAARGRVSRISSPPNEASEEDRWPFAWNPRSRSVKSAEPIQLSRRLVEDHDPRFDITEETYERLINHLRMVEGRGQQASFTFPDRQTINVLVGLFFKHHAFKKPVLHLPTFDTNAAGHPPELIGVMITIGAVYSLLRHTRRFAIVLLDVVRMSLASSSETDNALIRDPMFIYASLLTCWTGLWIGNKRAFELAEANRGAVVSYCRRIGFSKACGFRNNMAQTQTKSLDSRWRAWATEETLRRLCWCVYDLDCEFPILLNLPATIMINEVCDLELPCDEHFWNAPSAAYWTRLLGPGTKPQTRIFGAAIGPFIVPSISQTASAMAGSHDFSAALPLIPLNSWSRFLVMLAICVQVFAFTQELLVANNVCGELEEAGDNDLASTQDYVVSPNDTLHTRDSSSHKISFMSRTLMCQRVGGSADTVEWVIWEHLTLKRNQLASLLNHWREQIIAQHVSVKDNLGSRYFQECLRQTCELAAVMLDVPLTTAQSAIGKDGPDAISAAMSQLSRWNQASPRHTLQAAYRALRLINSLHPRNSSGAAKLAIVCDTGPHRIIAFFLCYVTFWAFVGTADEAQKLALLEMLDDDEEVSQSFLMTTFRQILLSQSVTTDAGGTMTRKDATRLVFKNASDGLTRMGTWGCALNLAVLLHARAEM